MSVARTESDAIHKLLGYSQDYLDCVHKDADELRASIQARDFQPVWYPCDSDSDLEDIDGAPMSPPQSPKDDVLDISVRAWDRRKWSDLARGIEPKDTGFDKFHTWRSHVISEHMQNVLPTSTSLQKPKGIKIPSSTSFIIGSQRSVFHILQIYSPH